jgi:hypothetical protein
MVQMYLLLVIQWHSGEGDGKPGSGSLFNHAVATRQVGRLNCAGVAAESETCSATAAGLAPWPVGRSFCTWILPAVGCAAGKSDPARCVALHLTGLDRRGRTATT